MSAESGYLRHGPYDIRGYNAGDLSLDITPTSIWVNGHVTTVAPTADLHAATKKYVDDAIAGGGDPTEYTGTIPIAVSDEHVISVGAADPQTSGVVTTGAQSFAGVKTFQSSPVVPAPTTDLQAATKKYVDDSITTGAAYTATLPIIMTGHDISIRAATTNTTGYVTATDQVLDGIKTFPFSPIVPTPTTDMQASTKKYVDDQITGLGIATTSPTISFATGTAVVLQLVITFMKVGNIVMAQIPSWVFTPTGDSYLTAAAESIPAGYRPSTGKEGWAQFLVDGSATAWGAAIFRPTGVIELLKKTNGELWTDGTAYDNGACVAMWLISS